MVDPEAARLALRRTEQTMLQLALASSQFRRGLARRLRMLIYWSLPAESERARRRALLLLGQAIGTGKLSQEQGTQALKMLGKQGPDGVRMVQIVRELQEWLERALFYFQYSPPERGPSLRENESDLVNVRRVVDIEQDLRYFAQFRVIHGATQFIV